MGSYLVIQKMKIPASMGFRPSDPEINIDMYGDHFKNGIKHYSC